MLIRACRTAPGAALLATLIAAAAVVEAQTIRTVAGTGTAGFSGDAGVVSASEARLNSPVGVHGDSTGQLWIADSGNHRIRRVNATFDTILTVAGTGVDGYAGDGASATSAQLSAPTDVFTSGQGVLYVADTGNHAIRRITAAGIISTVAGTGAPGDSGDGGAATSARLDRPSGLFVTAGGVIYIADRGNHRIRRVSAAGTITTVAGTGTAGFAGDGGPAASAQLNGPTDVYVDTAGTIYIADADNHRIRAIAPGDSTIRTVTGSGSAGFSGDGGAPTEARLAFPRSVFVDSVGSLYIADRFNQRLRRVDASGVITTLAGDGTFGVLGQSGEDGPANRARLSNPTGVWLHGGRDLFVVDGGTHRLRRIDDDNVRPLAGNTVVPPAGQAQLFGVGFTGDGRTAVKGLRLTLSDLSSATGLVPADLVDLRLYESDDDSWSPDDTLLDSLAADQVELGAEVAFQPSVSPVPAADVERFYLVTVTFDDDAVEGHAVRAAFPVGGLSTSIGGHGVRVVARDSDRLTIDVVATRLVFTTQPDGTISGNPLRRQPVVTAFDDDGFVDGDFTDTITLTVSGGTGSLTQATATAAAGVATFTGVTYQTAVDQETFALVADDEAGGAEGDLPAVTSNTLTANTVNDAPRVSPLRFTIDEDDSVVVPVSSMISDVDDSLSSLLITFTASNTQARVEGTQIVIRPEPDFHGLDTLLIVVEDAFGAIASGSSFLTVRSFNDRPRITSLGRPTIAEDDTLVVDMRNHASDVETAFESLRLTFVPSAGLTVDFDAASGLLRAWAPPGSFGVYTLRTTVMDADLTAATRLDTIQVLSVNHLPVVTFPAGLQLAHDGRLRVPLQATDADHAASSLTWSVVDALGLVVVLTGDSLTVRHQAGFSGPGWVVLRATDPEGGAGADSLRVEVLPPPPAPPRLAALPESSVTAGDTLVLPLAPFATDEDTPTAQLSWTVSPPVFGQATADAGTLRVVTVGEDAYEEQLTVVVRDPEALADSTTIRLVVMARPPLLQPLPATFTIDLVGGQLLLNPFLTDPADTSRVTWTGAVEGDLEVFIDARGVASIDVLAGSRAGGRVTFTATTPRRQASDTVAVSVANAVPVLRFPPAFLDAGEVVELLLDDFATDDDDVSLLRWTATSLDAGLSASVRQQIRLLTLTAGAGAAGQLRVVLEAADAQDSVGRDTMLVSVQAAPVDTTQMPDSTGTDTMGTNQPPVIAQLAALSLLAGERAVITLDGLAQDDGDVAELTWSAQAEVGVRVAIAPDARTLTIDADSTFEGATSIRLTVTDPFHARSTRTLTVLVRIPVVAPAPGDFDRDGFVGLDDFFLFVDRFGLSILQGGWDPAYDLVADGRIDFDDFFLFADLYQTAR